MLTLCKAEQYFRFWFPSRKKDLVGQQFFIFPLHAVVSILCYVDTGDDACLFVLINLIETFFIHTKIQVLLFSEYYGVSLTIKNAVKLFLNTHIFDFGLKCDFIVEKSMLIITAMTFYPEKTLLNNLWYIKNVAAAVNFTFLIFTICDVTGHQNKLHMDESNK